MIRARSVSLWSCLALASACGHAESPGITELGSSDLGSATSPVLAAHDAPQWSAWEAESFARARDENRILLINVVAEWCHWCHVMEEETYGDPEIARLLREHFVTIRVDSDARPDVAERYRRWGWPATAVLTPDAQPVLALRGYKHRDDFEALLRELVAERDAGTLARRHQPPPEPPRVDGALASLRDAATAQLDDFYDLELGGWGHKQKYPFPAPLEHALVRAHLYDEPQWIERAALTLGHEEAIIDPVWGGVYQYSVRASWNNPHYEKITAIQAGGIENYAMMARATGDDRWLASARAVADYMLDMMRAPEGGFYTSQDADLRRADGPTVVGADYYAEDDARRRALGLPRIDTAVYADLNGLMIRALVELYAATGSPEDLAAAEQAADRLLGTHRARRGGFTHADDDDPAGRLYLRDQAAMGWGLLALYRATGRAGWLEAAREVAALMHAELEDRDGGGFWAHTADPEAVGVFAERRKPVEENGLAARFLVELHHYTDAHGDDGSEPSHRTSAERALAAVGHPDNLAEHGRIIGRFALAVEAVLMPTVDVTVVGDDDDPSTVALHRAALHMFEPRAVIERSRPGTRYPDIGRAAVYLCTDTACSSPISDPGTLHERTAAFVAESLPPRTR